MWVREAFAEAAAEGPARTCHAKRGRQAAPGEPEPRRAAQEEKESDEAGKTAERRKEAATSFPDFFSFP